jgi:hypothetical protein
MDSPTHDSFLTLLEVASEMEVEHPSACASPSCPSFVCTPGGFSISTNALEPSTLSHIQFDEFVEAVDVGAEVSSHRIFVANGTKYWLRATHSASTVSVVAIVWP